MFKSKITSKISSCAVSSETCTRVIHVKACLKTLLSENQYMESRGITSKDSNISIYESFEISTEPQSIDDQFA